VVAGSTAALICDTGALLDYLVENAPDHRLFRSAIDRARTRYVPAPVLAELDYSSSRRAARDGILHAGSCTRRLYVRSARAR
jgi:predicted nucleic acid-binding protein